MRRFAAGLALICVLAVTLAGCATPDEKPIITLVDQQGIAETRTVSVGYVNERLEHMPPAMLPPGEGDEAKLAFLNEIVRKELIVIAGYRLGLDEDPRIEMALEHMRDQKAEKMLEEDVITAPSQVTQEEVEEYYTYRDAMYQMREIVVQDEELANEAYRRVTEGGEDFAAVAREVSTAASAADGGRRPQIQAWTDMHPLTRVAIKHAESGDIIGPVRIQQTFYVFEILSKKVPPNREPLEGRHLTGITNECRGFKRDILQHEVIEGWMNDANITYNWDGMDLAGARIEDQVNELLPPHEGEMTSEIAIQRAKTKIVPQFNEEEAAMDLVTFTIGGETTTWTLGDYARILDESQGIETPKRGLPEYIEDSVRKRVFKMIVDHEIEKRGYLTSGEMEEYIAARREESIVDLTYGAEISQKMVEPSGTEIREYFRANRDKFVRPPRADVRQLIVGEEAQANLIRQQILEGEADFIEMIRTHSIDSWSQARDGLIENVLQGEGRLSYLQEPAFALELNELSEPIRAPGGFALIMVLNREPEEQLEFSEVGSVVVEHVTAERREARLVEFLDEVRETVEVTIHEENLGLMTDPADAADKMETMRLGTGG